MGELGAPGSRQRWGFPELSVTPHLCQPDPLRLKGSLRRARGAGGQGAAGGSPEALSYSLLIMLTPEAEKGGAGGAGGQGGSGGSLGLSSYSHPARPPGYQGGNWGALGQGGRAPTPVSALLGVTSRRELCFSPIFGVSPVEGGLSSSGAGV